MSESWVVDLEQISSWMQNGDRVVFVDARRDEDWRASNEQIPGSIRLVPEQIDQHLIEVPRGTRLIIYSSDVDLRSSHEVASHLRELDIFFVYVLRGGLATYVEAGLPMSPKGEAWFHPVAESPAY
jgi:rhodanese-related sulfurtransferase